jgi:hypothetical protein
MENVLVQHKGTNNFEKKRSTRPILQHKSLGLVIIISNFSGSIYLMRLLQQKTNGFAIISVCQGETKRGIPKGGAQLRHAFFQPKREQVCVVSCVQCPSSQRY